MEQFGRQPLLASAVPRKEQRGASRTCWGNTQGLPWRPIEEEIGFESTVAPHAKKSKPSASRKKFQFESGSECSDETSESGKEEEVEEESESTKSTTSGEVEEVEPAPPMPQTLNWIFIPVRETKTTAMAILASSVDKGVEAAEHCLSCKDHPGGLQDAWTSLLDA